MCVRCKRRIACKCGVCVQGGYYALVKVPPNPKGQTTHVCIYLYWLIFQSNKKPFCQYKREKCYSLFSPLKTHTSKSVKMSKRHVLLYLLEKFFVPAITISDICGGIERLMCFLGRGSHKNIKNIVPIAFASVLYSGCLHLDVSEKWLWAIDEKIEIGCNFSGPVHSFC